MAGKSLFTGLSAVTHFGRPNFQDFLKSVRSEHPNVCNLCFAFNLLFECYTFKKMHYSHVSHSLISFNSFTPLIHSKIWVGFFSEQVRTFGVFSCGPPNMTNNLDGACTNLNKQEGATFNHHFENF